MPLNANFETFDVETLMGFLNPDFNIGRTYFHEPYKRYMISHNYYLIHEVNSNEEDVEEWETFGYEVELIQQAGIKPVFGPTAKRCLINFFTKHPKLILVDINTDNHG